MFGVLRNMEPNDLKQKSPSIYFIEAGRKGVDPTIWAKLSRVYEESYGLHP